MDQWYEVWGGRDRLECAFSSLSKNLKVVILDFTRLFAFQLNRFIADNPIPCMYLISFPTAARQFHFLPLSLGPLPRYSNPIKVGIKRHWSNQSNLHAHPFNCCRPVPLFLLVAWQTWHPEQVTQNICPEDSRWVLSHDHGPNQIHLRAIHLLDVRDDLRRPLFVPLSPVGLGQTPVLGANLGPTGHHSPQILLPAGFRALGG